MARSVYLKLETRILQDEQGGILDRWKYGKECLEAKRGRQQLPHGFIKDRLDEAERAGMKLSEREIQWRVKCAEVYGSEAEVRTASTDFGSWTALREAGFPAVEIDEPIDPDDLEDIGEPDPLEEKPEQLALDIPGFKPVLKINGRKVTLTEATVREAVEYRDMVHEMHENFGRTVAQIDATVEAMLEGCEGDLDANAVEAWKRANQVDEDSPTNDDPPIDPEDGI